MKLRKDEIVDSDGKIIRPKILFHGTETDIKKFDYVGKENSNDEIGVGIYLTDNFDEATRYGKYVYVIYLDNDAKEYDMKRELSYTEIKNLIYASKYPEDNLMNYDENLDVALNKFIEYNQPKKYGSYDILLSIWYEFYRYEPKNFLQQLKIQLDVDYIKIKRYKDSTHYVIFNPEIINIIDTNIIG